MTAAATPQPGRTLGERELSTLFGALMRAMLLHERPRPRLLGRRLNRRRSIILTLFLPDLELRGAMPAEKNPDTAALEVKADTSP
jgi:hypothetical protein